MCYVYIYNITLTHHSKCLYYLRIFPLNKHSHNLIGSLFVIIVYLCHPFSKLTFNFPFPSEGFLVPLIQTPTRSDQGFITFLLKDGQRTINETVLFSHSSVTSIEPLPSSTSRFQAAVPPTDSPTLTTRILGWFLQLLPTGYTNINQSS